MYDTSCMIHHGHKWNNIKYYVIEKKIGYSKLLDMFTVQWMEMYLTPSPIGVTPKLVSAGSITSKISLFFS